MRICNVEECLRNCFGGGYCKSHQYLRNDLKPIKKSYKPIKKISEKGKLKKAEKTIRTKEIHLVMFNFWAKSDKKCQSCGVNLPDFRTYMVDHLLEKSKYPEFALDERNFYLTCFEDHSSKTNGFPTENHKKAIIIAKNTLLKYD